MGNHYETLGLSQRKYDGSLTFQDIKQAYRRALLQHHPDKAQDVDGAAQTVDAITLAYKTLSEPATKADYDRELRLKESRKDDDKIFHTGLDIVDLDDLDYDEATGEWWRACRCGQERGFIVTENELEKESRYGELITGCKGCSLWLKVLFGVEEEETQDTQVTG